MSIFVQLLTFPFRLLIFIFNYVFRVLLISFKLTGVVTKELSLPYISLDFSKDRAFPRSLWGILFKNWRRTRDVSVFVKGFDERGENNRYKFLMFSTMNEANYFKFYQKESISFFDKVFASSSKGQPLQKNFLDQFPTFFWKRTFENNIYATTFEKRKSKSDFIQPEHVGYSPFGFGYHRCAGEILTFHFFKDLIKYMMKKDISFETMNSKTEDISLLHKCS